MVAGGLETIVAIAVTTLVSVFLVVMVAYPEVGLA